MRLVNIKISNKDIGESFPTYFIAEAGLNHNGDINLAKKMVDEAKNANSDAIKFQTYKSENFLSESSEYFDFFKNVELSFEEFKEIKQYADNVDIAFLSTPFDLESVDLLEEIGISAYKIASGDITNYPLLKKVAYQNKPIFLSTGASEIQEISDAVNLIEKVGNSQIAILHCILSYPTANEHANL